MKLMMEQYQRLMVCLAQAQEESRESEFSSNDSSSSEDEEGLDPRGLGETSGTNDTSE